MPTDMKSAFGGIRRAFGNNAPMAPAQESEEEKMAKMQALQQLMQQQPQMAPAPSMEAPMEQGRAPAAMPPDASQDPNSGAMDEEARLREQEYLRKKYRAPTGGVQ